MYHDEEGQNWGKGGGKCKAFLELLLPCSPIFEKRTEEVTDVSERLFEKKSLFLEIIQNIKMKASQISRWYSCLTDRRSLQISLYKPDMIQRFIRKSLVCVLLFL